MEKNEGDSPQRVVNFKDTNYQKTKATQDKKRSWKSLRQILTLERSMPWDKDSVHYSSIDAPLSSKPPKRYSDISGLPAKYRDPTTNLLYATAEEHRIIKALPSDIVTGYLALRKASGAS